MIERLGKVRGLFSYQFHWEMRVPAMTEAGHEDRTILDALAPLFVVEDDPETPKPLVMKARSAVQGAIIGQLLPRFAEDEVPETLDIDMPLAFLSRSYLDV
jgi:hypothetical protein